MQVSRLPCPSFPFGAKIGFGKRGLLEKGSFQKSPFSRDSREFRDSRDFREAPNSGKERRIRPLSRDSREFRDFRDSRDSSSEKTPFVMTPFSGPEKTGFLANRVFACVTPAIFVIFVVFRGLRSKALVFVDRVSIRRFRRFRQNPLFSVGGKDPVWLRPRFCPPDP